MNLLEELRHVNPNEPGSWPAVIKGRCACTVAGDPDGGRLFSGLGRTVDDAGAGAGRRKYTQKYFSCQKTSAVNLDVLRQQLAEVQQTLGTLLKQLPNKSELDALLVDINRAGLGRGCSSSCSNLMPGRRCGSSMPNCRLPSE